MRIKTRNVMRTAGYMVALAFAALALPGCGGGNVVEAADLRQPSYYFRVLIDDVEVDSVLEVRGLDVQVEAEEFVDPSDPVVRKRPGRVKYGDITLKRSYGGDRTFSSWIDEARTGAVGRRSVTIEIFGLPTGKRIRQYNFFECWPTRWALDADTDGDGFGDTERSGDLVEVIVLSAGAFSEG